MKINRDGKNRTVILTKRHAFKFPSMRSWQDFLYGLLNNRVEARVGRSGREDVCPVLWHIPGGWLTVMPRLRVMDSAEFNHFDAEDWIERRGLSVEPKADSFGWLDGRPVAIDYGWGN